MKNLEDIISQNREEFDDKSPPSSLWDRIEEELPAPSGQKQAKMVPLHLVLKVAAAVSFLLVAGAIGWNMGSTVRQQEKDGLVFSSDMPEDLRRAEAHFTSLINRQIEELQDLGSTEQQQLTKVFINDLKRLEADYKALKIELEGSHYNERVLKALVDNLMLQTRLLNQQIEIINTLKNEKPTENETLRA